MTEFPTHHINYVKLATSVSQLHNITVQMPRSGQNLLCGLGLNLKARSKITLTGDLQRYAEYSLAKHIHTFMVCNESLNGLFSQHTFYIRNPGLVYPVFPGRLYRLVEDLFITLQIPSK